MCKFNGCSAIFSFLISISIPAYCLANSGIVVAADGKSQISIVLTESSSRLMHASAKDLARCLGKTAGVQIPVVNSQADVKTPFLISLDIVKPSVNPGLKRDGYQLKTEGNHLQISGISDAGVSNGVYTFLAEVLGVRWFSPDALYEIFPARPKLTFPRLNITRNPDFRYRMLPGAPGTAGADWQRRSRLDLNDLGIARFGFGHNLFNILPVSKYGKSHPEYYPMIDGRRKVPVKNAWDEVNPCLTNPDVIRIAAEAARAYFKENPEQDTFPVSINDSADYCHCPVCEKLNIGAQPGQGGVPSFADSYFYFVSEVAKQVAISNPGKHLGCFPYWPVYPITRWIDHLPDNVVIQLTQDTSQQHDSNYRREERAQWVSWRRKVSTMGKYDYYDLGWLTPRYFPHIAASDLKFIKDNGCDGFFCGLAPNWSMLGPQIYVTTRLLWDSHLNPDTLLDEYFTKVFGPASSDMKHFYDTLERYWLQPRKARWFEGLAGLTSEYTLINGPLIEEAWQSLIQAEIASSGEDKLRVQDVKKHFRLSYLLVKMQSDAKELASRKLTNLADLNQLANDILTAMNYLPEVKADYNLNWKPDPNYNISYYSEGSMSGRLRDWAYEQRKWLTFAIQNARKYVSTLPADQRKSGWNEFSKQIVARDKDLDTKNLVRDYRVDFDRSDATLNNGKGLSDSQNRDGELAWGESYQLMGYMEMYRATRDPIYLRHLITHFDRVLKNRDDVLGKSEEFAGKPLAGWGSDRYSNGKWHVWIVHTGMILSGPAEFVRSVTENKSLQAEFGAKAAVYRSRIEESIRDADPYWHNGPEPDEGYYDDPFLKQVQPLNQQNALGIVMLEMWKATGSKIYLDRVQRLAHFFHRRLLYPHSDFYDWSYWPKLNEDGTGSEDISHAGINVRFAELCREEGLVFTSGETVRMARAWLENVRRANGTWADSVNGEGKGNTYMPYAAGSWIVLCPSLPDHVATKLYQDAVQAFSEEKQYNQVEMLGIARLLRLSPSGK